MLEIRNLVKTYGSGPRAVDGLTLSVEAGDICGFIGHNGAGKTTTLKCVSGILPFDEGEITIDGLSIKTQPLEAKRIMRYIPDNPDLYGFLTGVGYLNFLCDIYGIDEATRNERIARYAALFEIESKLGDLVSSYSHGMCQKLALIGALVQQPKLLMLDEPSMGLAPILVEQIFDIVQELNRAGTTILLVEQNAQMALSIANRAYVLETGNIVKSGDAHLLMNDDDVRKAYLG